MTLRVLKGVVGVTLVVLLCAVLSLAGSVAAESAYRAPIRWANGQLEQVRADLRSQTVDQAAFTLRLAHGALMLREPDMIERWKAVAWARSAG